MPREEQPQQPKANVPVSKFSMEKDENSRKLAKKTHSAAVLLREAGLPIKSIGSADSVEIRTEFKLPKENTYSILQFTDLGEEKNMEVIDWLSNGNSKVKVIKHDVHEYRDKTRSFRVIVDCNLLM